MFGCISGLLPFGYFSKELPSNLTQCHLDSQVKLADWMKGQTCGLCGKADGEVRQEFRTPNGHLAKDTVSYAHSWVIPAESCQDATGKKRFGLTPPQPRLCVIIL